MNKWMIPDMYYPSESMPGSIKSHEAICVLNATAARAEIAITLYFEDREPMKLALQTCEARRTVHIRMDLIRDDEGNPVPMDTPYAALVESEAELAVQYSRADARQNALAIMTTMVAQA